MAQNEANVRKLIDETFNKGKMELVDKNISERYVGHDAVLGELDREGFKKRIQNLRTGFPDLQFKIDEIVEANDRVFFRWSWRGTHQGSFLGAAATNKRIEASGMCIVRFEGNKAVEDWTTMDTLDLARKLGLAPAAEAESRF